MFLKFQQYQFQQRSRELSISNIDELFLYTSLFGLQKFLTFFLWILYIVLFPRQLCSTRWNIEPFRHPFGYAYFITSVSKVSLFVGIEVVIVFLLLIVIIAVFNYGLVSVFATFRLRSIVILLFGNTFFYFFYVCDSIEGGRQIINFLLFQRVSTANPFFNSFIVF